jgi:hypothetical protein
VFVINPMSGRSLSRTAFVPTVVPWLKNETSPVDPSTFEKIFSTPSRTPVSNRGGVEGVFVVVTVSRFSS